jgi:hypothetical protein
MHGLVSAYCDHGNMVWPRIDDLIADTVALHSAQPRKDIVLALERSSP